jgi:DNA-binding CsgD family transcriptional regulator
MLVGRDRELATVAQLLEAARTGTSRVLAIVGEPGIGKSSLLDWAAAAAGERGMGLLRARGVQSEAHIPFAGLFELLRPALASIERLPEPQAAALESALALRPAQAHDRFAVGAATLSLIAAHAEAAPLLVLVDDAHWLDGSSVDALRFALRRLEADPIAVLLTVREGETSLLDGSDLEAMRLKGLDADATAALLRSLRPEIGPDATTRLLRDTGGNPLALRELARERPPETPLDTPVPVAASIGAAYLERVHALPERTGEALVVAAAADRGDLVVLAVAIGRLGLDPADLVPAEEGGLIAIAAGRIEFSHPLMRSAVYAGAAPERRRAAHRALADALPDSDADRRAWHLALAALGPDERVSSALEQAGARARDRSAYDVASRAYERAAQLATPGRRAPLAHAAAETAWLGGLPDRARSLLDAAAGWAPDEGLQVEIEHLRGHIALRRGPLAEGRAILLAAAERAAVRTPGDAIVMLAEAAEGAFFAGDAAGVQACGERARALADGSVPGQAAYFAQITEGMGEILTGEGDRGAALLRDAVSLLERSDTIDVEPRLLAWAAMGPLWLREAGTGEGLIERAVTAARSRSAAGILPHLLTHVAIALAAGDRWAEAEATFDEAVRLAGETGQRTILAGALARLATVEARCGRDAAAAAHAGEALPLARDLGAHLFEIWALSAFGEVALARGDAATALERFDEQQAALERHAVVDADLSPAPERVDLLLRLGRGADAAAAAAPFLALAAAKGQPWALARAGRCRALLAGNEAFAADFDTALALHRQTPDAFETARTLLALGARLRRTGRRMDARGPLREALAAFDGVGATPWAELAGIELAATGETARRRDPSTLDDLTAQELRIAFLLAGGRTTRQAAAALFLSPKTVEYHLRNAYRKLGVRTRAELTAALARRDG